jgi:VanZ like family
LPDRCSRRPEPVTWAAAAWSALILALCWLPRDLLFAIETKATGGFEIGHLNLDKVFHVGLFVGFGWLWMRAGETSVPDPRRQARSVLIGGLAFALMSEVVQAIPFIGRTAHLVDYLCDVAGLFIGVAIASKWHPRRT